MARLAKEGASQGKASVSITAQASDWSALCFLHDPVPRVILHEEGGWQVRIHPRNCDDHPARAAEGRLHLQLWHAARCVSVLLPSAATAQKYEIFPIEDTSERLSSYEEVRALLADVHDLEPPEDARLAELRVWFVLSALIGATRP